MKTQIAFATLIGLAMIACTQNEPETVRTSVLEPIGYGSITFTDDSQGQPTLNLQSKALNGYASGFIEVKRISVNSFTVGARPSATSVGGYRYVSFTYAVRNAASPVSPATSGVASSIPRSNLTFVPVSISGAGGTLNSPLITPIRSLGKFDGSLASASIAPEVQPTHGSRFNAFTGAAQVIDDRTDLQVFTEAEMTNFTTSASGWPSTYSPFPYGFVVRSKYNTSNRTLGANPPVGQFDGLVTFGFKVPLQATAADDPFVYNVQFVIAQDNAVRVTKSNEESSATRARAEATVLGGSLVEDGAVCAVRYAGAAGSITSKSLYGFGARGLGFGGGAFDVCFGSVSAAQFSFYVADGGNAASLQPDGKILVAGTANGDFVLARLNANGTLDTSFGSGGKTTFDIFGLRDTAYAIGLQPDGKILLAGNATRNVTPTGLDATSFGLVRFNANGTVDSSFGFFGRVNTEFTNIFNEAKALVLQPDGKILVAGSVYGFSGSGNFAAARFNADGTLDSSFGTDGKRIIDFAGFDDRANAMALQPDGKILIAGSTVTANLDPGDFGVVRLNSDGTLDSGFGVNGLTHIDFDSSSYDYANAIALQSDGKILLAGQAVTGNSNFGMLRFNANGTLDTGFGTGGKVVYAPSGGSNYSANAIALQPDGKILLAGRTSDANLYFVAARFNPNGALDSSFNGNNKSYGFTIANNQADSQINGIVVQPDGRILAVGTALIPNSFIGDIALVRYNP
jgi:uncharacterized delta-60 repeat protein